MIKTTTRVQLELPKRSMERLKKLRDVSEAASYAEVIRNALRLYEGLLEEHQNGGEVTIKKRSGEETSVQFVF